MFGWLRRRAAQPQPEAKWIVHLAEDRIGIVDDTGEAKTLLKSDMSAVAVETNDSGPWGVDFWWLLFGADDRLACVFPQGASGEEAAMAYLMTLDGFDLEQLTQAMRSTENAVFPLWRKGG